MCWCWPCRSPCISVEEVDPSEKSYYRAHPNSKYDLYAQSTSSKKSKYLSSVSSVGSVGGGSKTSSLPKSSSKHHITQNTTTTRTTITNGPTRRAPEKTQKEHKSHSITADSPPKRRSETTPNGDKKSSSSKSSRGRNSSTSSSERSSRSKSRRGRNPSTASSQRSRPSMSHRERHPSTASSERTGSSKALHPPGPKSSRGRRGIEIDPAIKKKAISESVSSGSSTLVESEEEDISTKNPSTETLLDVSQTSPSPTPSLRRSRRKIERKYIISDGRADDLRTEDPKTENQRVVTMTPSVSLHDGRTEDPRTENRKTEGPGTGKPKMEGPRIENPVVEGPRREDTATVTVTPSAAIRSSQPERRRHRPSTQSAPAGAFDSVAGMSQASAIKVSAPARRQHRSTGAQAPAKEGPFNPLLGMSLDNSYGNAAADLANVSSSASSARHLKLLNGPRSPEEFQQDISSFVQAMKFDTLYSEDDPYVQKVSDRAAELVRRKTTITSDDENTCIPDNIAGMARVALYDVVLLCDDSASMQHGNRTQALQEMVRRIAKITGLFETEGIKLRCINSKQDGEFNNIRTLEDVEVAMSKIKFSGQHTKIGTMLWDKILVPLVFDKIDSNNLTRPLLISIITDGAPLGEDSDVFKNMIAKCRRELIGRGYDPSLVVFQLNQVGNDIQATRFTHGLSRSRNVHCTSELLDVKIESLRGNNLQLENWLVTRLTQGIFPTPNPDE